MKEVTTTKKGQNSDTSQDINVLVVDDNPVFLDLTNRQFEKHAKNISLQTCDTPEEVLETIRNQNIDCVLSDYMMPGMNGIQLLKEVRSRKPNLPFIILTSEGNEEIASQAIASDVTDYIKKGGSQEDYQLIINRIENAVMKNRAEKKRLEEQKRYEKTLKALQEINQELLDAENQEEIVELTLKASSDILNFPGVGIYLFNEDKQQLDPAANTNYLEELFGQMPTLDSKSESITWRSFNNQEITKLDDITNVDMKYTDKTPIHSGIWVPIGRKGIIGILSEKRSEFSERDLHLTDILASATETALKRVEKEEKLRESKNRYRTLIENLPNGSVALFDKDLRFQTARGETIERAYGESSKIEGETIYDMYDGKTLDKIEDTFNKALEGEKASTDVEVEGMHLSVLAAPLRDENGDVISGLSVAQDITGKEERKKDLELYEDMLKSIEDTVYLVDPEGKFRWVNEKAAAKKGYKKDDIIGKPTTKVIPEDQVKEIRTEAEKAFKEGKDPIKKEISIKTADGQYIPAEINFSTYKFSDGCIGRIGVARDITDKKESEKDLQLFEKVIETINDGI